MFNPKNRGTRYIITTLTIKALKGLFVLLLIKNIMVTKMYTFTGFLRYIILSNNYVSYLR